MKHRHRKLWERHVVGVKESGQTLRAYYMAQGLNRPCSRRMHGHAPVASPTITLIRELARLRNTSVYPSKTSPSKADSTRTSKWSMPKRKSIGSQASRRRVGWSISAIRTTFATAIAGRSCRRRQPNPAWPVQRQCVGLCRRFCDDRNKCGSSFRSGRLPIGNPPSPRIQRCTLRLRLLPQPASTRRRKKARRELPESRSGSGFGCWSTGCCCWLRCDYALVFRFD